MSVYCSVGPVVSKFFFLLYPYSDLEKHVHFNCDWFYNEAEHGPGFGQASSPHLSPLESIHTAHNRVELMQLSGKSSFTLDEKRRRKQFTHQMFLRVQTKNYIVITIVWESQVWIQPFGTMQPIIMRIVHA